MRWLKNLFHAGGQKSKTSDVDKARSRDPSPNPLESDDIETRTAAFLEVKDMGTLIGLLNHARHPDIRAAAARRLADLERQPESATTPPDADAKTAFQMIESLKPIDKNREGELSAMEPIAQSDAIQMVRSAIKKSRNGNTESSRQEGDACFKESISHNLDCSDQGIDFCCETTNTLTSIDGSFQGNGRTRWVGFQIRRDAAGSLVSAETHDYDSW